MLQTFPIPLAIETVSRLKCFLKKTFNIKFCFSQGKKYIVRKGMCRATGAPPAMREMCLPGKGL